MRPSLLKRHLLKQFENKNTCLITGSPGVGKTQLIKSVVEAYKKKHNTKCDLIISHPVVKDPTDYKGLGALVNGKAEFLPFGDLRKLIEAEVPTLCLFDDMGQSQPSVQAAMMQLLLEREIDGNKVSDHVVFFAATNRASDRAGVSGILEPVKSRFKTIIKFDVDLNDWIEWAFLNQLPSELISFIRFKPHFITDEFKPSREIVNSTSPRTIANVGSLQKEGIDKEIEFEVIEGAAGTAFALEYFAFLKLSRDLPTAEMILRNPDTINIPTKVDQIYAICGALAYAITEDNFSNVNKFLERLAPEYSVMTVRDALGLNPSIASSPYVDKWFENHSELLLA